jgi:hypothetical protein
LDYGFNIFIGFGFGFGLEIDHRSDFKSVLSNGFGFGVGFSINLRLGWIMDSIYFSDLDLVLDSVLASGWVGLWI